MTVRPLSDRHIAEIDAALLELPEHLRGGLRRYLVDRTRPGDFLLAVLRNDLLEAVGRADDISVLALRRIVEFLYLVAPERSWGTPGAVEGWLSAATVEAAS